MQGMPPGVLWKERTRCMGPRLRGDDGVVFGRILQEAR